MEKIHSCSSVLFPKKNLSISIPYCSFSLSCHSVLFRFFNYNQDLKTKLFISSSSSSLSLKLWILMNFDQYMTFFVWHSEHYKQFVHLMKQKKNWKWSWCVIIICTIIDKWERKIFTLIIFSFHSPNIIIYNQVVFQIIMITLYMNVTIFLTCSNDDDDDLHLHWIFFVCFGEWKKTHWLEYILISDFDWFDSIYSISGLKNKQKPRWILDESKKKTKINTMEFEIVKFFIQIIIWLLLLFFFHENSQNL